MGREEIMSQQRLEVVDPANPPPAVGSATNIVFAPDKALVLLDSEAVAYEEKE